MVATRKLEVQITGDASGAGRAFGSVRNDADSTQSHMSRWATGIAGAIGIGFATDTIIDWGSTLISAAEESAQVTAQTTAVIKSMGAESWVSAKGIAELAEQISLKTGLDDEMIQSGENVLLTFGNVRNAVGEGNDIFDRATKAATDLSVAWGQDLQSSMVQIGKALNDPIAGLTALGRVGVQFTEQQKDQIKTMVEAGDVMGAQKVILGELERQVGGSAEAQATASGKLKVAWDNIIETLGGLLLPTFEKVANWLAEKLPIAIDISIAWVKEHESQVKILAITVGVLLFGALLLWAAGMATAAASTLAATWPVLLAALVVVALAGAFIYAYTHVDFFRKMVDDTVDQLQDLWKWVKDNKDLFEELGPVIKFVVIAQLYGLLILVVAITAAVKVMVTEWQIVLGAIKKVGDAITAVRNSASGLSTLPGPIGGLGKFLGLAEGGIVTKPTLALVGEAGPEAVVPLSRAGGIGGGGGAVVVNVHVGSLVGNQRDLVEYINDALQRGYRLQQSGRAL
jgi:hypothetical protein